MAKKLVRLPKVSASLKGMEKSRKEILGSWEFPSCFFSIETELCRVFFFSYRNVSH